VEPREKLLHVGGEVQRVGDDDEVEGSSPRGGIESFAGLHLEAAVRQPGAGGGDATRRKVDAGDIAGAEQREEVALAAADLQYSGVGGNEKVVVVGEAVAVGARSRPQSARHFLVPAPHLLEVSVGQSGNRRG
jgi:hypothetical protein